MQHRSRGIVCPEFQTHYTFYCVADVYLVACAPNRTQWQQQGAVCSGGPPPQRTNLRLAIGRITSPGPLLTPPPSFSPPKTPHRSYSAITPPRYVNPTPPSPGGRGSSRQGRGMGGQNGPQADADVRDQNYVSNAIHFVCVYTPCLYIRYT